MGCLAINYLPPKTSRKEVKEFLELLGYIKLPRDRFTSKGVVVFSNRPNDYKYFQGIYAELCFDKDEGLTVQTRTNIWRSRCDTDLHNHTVKQLKKRFGGYFASDHGKNNYLTNDHPYIERDEAGCYQAYSRFFSNIQTASFTIKTWQKAKTDRDWSSITGIPWFDSLNPLVITANITVPFLVSIIEDYFRSTYVALLKYSDNRESIVRDSRILGEELNLISKGEITIEEAVARTRSFQNMKRILQSFRELDNKIDAGSVLRKPYPHRNKPIYDIFEDIISHRHMIIHRSEIITNYTPKILLRDIKTIHEGIQRFYLSLVELYGWYYEHPALNLHI